MRCVGISNLSSVFALIQIDRSPREISKKTFSNYQGSRSPTTMAATRLLPKTTPDKIAFFLGLFGMTYVAFFELLVVMPAVYPDQGVWYYLTACIGTMMYLNCMVWFFALMHTSSTTEGMLLPAILKPGWRYCSVCESNSPPRCHHCFICDRCVMGRDHHCAFTGSCVGYKNHRFFYILLVYLQIASMYATFLNFDYTWEVLGGFNPQSMFTMVLPFMAYVLGFAQAFSFFAAMSSSFIIMSFLFMTALLVYHTILILNGQTMHEKAKGDYEYDVGQWGNFLNVFGRNWKIAWLSPWIRSPLPSDGTWFQGKNDYEVLKAR